MFIEDNDAICIFNGYKLITKKLGNMKISQSHIYKMQLPKILNYITRRDRITYLQMRNDRVIFIANYGVFIFSLMTGDVKKVLNLKVTRSIFQNSFVHLENNYYFFDYSSSGLENGIAMHISKDDGESWDSSIIIKKGNCKRVISSHYLNYSNKIIISTGDDEKNCKIYLLCLNDNSIKCIATGSEDLRFMNILSENKNTLEWISNNRIKGSALICFNLQTGKFKRREIFAMPTNIWHSTIVGEKIYAAETIEPVKFYQNKKIIRVFEIFDKKSRVISTYHVSKLKYFFRYPSIEFLRSQNKKINILVTGTTQDGVFSVLDNSAVIPFPFLDYCIQNHIFEIKVWSIKTRDMIDIWKEFVKKTNIKKALNLSANSDLRKRNIIEKCKDYL